MNQEFICGIHPVLEAIKSGKIIDQVFIQYGLTSHNAKIIEQKLIYKKIKIKYVSIKKLNQISTRNHQGIIAFLSSCKLFSIKNILPGIIQNNKHPFLLILDRITDVRNFGALVRTAECVGVDAVIIGNTSNAPIDCNSMKTSSGALNWVPICKETNLSHVINYIQKMGIQIVAATQKTNEIVFNSTLKKPIAVIIGSEKNGIAQKLLKQCNFHVKLPLYGKIKSLNVSVACGAILYEIVRQNSN